MKRIAVFAALAASIMVLPTTASARTDCPASYTTQTVNGITLGVQAGPGGTTGSAEAAAGVCVDIAGGASGFHGGLAEAGVGTTEGVINPGGTGGVGPITGLPGAYAVVDGDDANTLVSTQGGGYIGVSNYEEGGTGADPTCDGVDEGTGSNSGQCFHIKNTPVAVPFVPLVCGNTTGPSWDAAGRDGCSVP